MFYVDVRRRPPFVLQWFYSCILRTHICHFSADTAPIIMVSYPANRANIFPNKGSFSSIIIPFTDAFQFGYRPCHIKGAIPFNLRSQILLLKRVSYPYREGMHPFTIRPIHALSTVDRCRLDLGHY